jgi:hypothetical protein
MRKALTVRIGHPTDLPLTRRNSVQGLGTDRQEVGKNILGKNI